MTTYQEKVLKKFDEMTSYRDGHSNLTQAHYAPQIRLFIKEALEGQEQLYEIPCGDGAHPTFWKTVIESPQWKPWSEHASKEQLYDMPEVEECGIISPGHFQAFIRFMLEGQLREIAENIKQSAKTIGENTPEGDWYLFPPGVHHVVGYLSDSIIGEIAYKGIPMNIPAVIEEALLQISLSIEGSEK